MKPDKPCTCHSSVNYKGNSARDTEGDDYVSKVAWNLEETCKLVEAGLDFVCEIDGAKIFRKRQ